MSTGPYGVQFNFVFQPSGVFSTLWGKASELFYDLQHSLGAVQQVVRSSFCVPLLTKKKHFKIAKALRELLLALQSSMSGYLGHNTNRREHTG